MLNSLLLTMALLLIQNELITSDKIIISTKLSSSNYNMKLEQRNMKKETKQNVLTKAYNNADFQKTSSSSSQKISITTTTAPQEQEEEVKEEVLEEVKDEAEEEVENEVEKEIEEEEKVSIRIVPVAEKAVNDNEYMKLKLVPFDYIIQTNKSISALSLSDIQDITQEYLTLSFSALSTTATATNADNDNRCNDVKIELDYSIPIGRRRIRRMRSMNTRRINKVEDDVVSTFKVHWTGNVTCTMTSSVPVSQEEITAWQEEAISSDKGFSTLFQLLQEDIDNSSSTTSAVSSEDTSNLISLSIPWNTTLMALSSDIDTKKINIATDSISSTSQQQYTTNSKSNNSAMIIVLVLICILCCVLTIMLLYLLYKRKQYHKNKTDSLERNQDKHELQDDASVSSGYDDENDDIGISIHDPSSSLYEYSDDSKMAQVELPTTRSSNASHNNNNNSDNESISMFSYGYSLDGITFASNATPTMSKQSSGVPNKGDCIPIMHYGTLSYTDDDDDDDDDDETNNNETNNNETNPTNNNTGITDTSLISDITYSGCKKNNLASSGNKNNVIMMMALPEEEDEEDQLCIETICTTDCSDEGTATEVFLTHSQRQQTDPAVQITSNQGNEMLELVPIQVNRKSETKPNLQQKHHQKITTEITPKSSNQKHKFKTNGAVPTLSTWFSQTNDKNEKHKSVLVVSNQSVCSEITGLSGFSSTAGFGGTNMNNKDDMLFDDELSLVQELTEDISSNSNITNITNITNNTNNTNNTSPLTPLTTTPTTTPKITKTKKSYKKLNDYKNENNELLSSPTASSTKKKSTKQKIFSYSPSPISPTNNVSSSFSPYPQPKSQESTTVVTPDQDKNENIEKKKKIVSPKNYLSSSMSISSSSNKTVQLEQQQQQQQHEQLHDHNTFIPIAPNDNQNNDHTTNMHSPSSSHSSTSGIQNNVSLSSRSREDINHYSKQRTPTPIPPFLNNDHDTYMDNSKELSSYYSSSASAQNILLSSSSLEVNTIIREPSRIKIHVPFDEDDVPFDER